MALTWNEKGDEKIPLSSEKTSGEMGHGAIPRSSRITSPAVNEKKEDGEKELDREPTEEDPEPGPMSLSRKFVMFLSLNCGVFFVAFFAVLLPCRQELAPHVNASSTNLNNRSVSSNIPIINEDLSGAVVFRYLRDNETGSRIVCEFDDFSSWKIMFDFTPIGCRCEIGDVNEDSYLDCILSGKSQRAVFKTSEDNESRRQVFFNSVFVPGSKERWILQNCVLEEMCLSIMAPRVIRTVGIFMKNEETEMMIRNVRLPCGKHFERNMKWSSESKNLRFSFNCSC